MSSLAAAAARAAGTWNEYGRGSTPTVAVPSVWPSSETSTVAGGAEAGRPPFSITIVSSDASAGIPTMDT